MKTGTTIKLIRVMQFILIIILIEMRSTAQSTIPEFRFLNSVDISNSDGIHDGAGCIDIDNDGDQDLIITNSASGNSDPNLLYRNERNNRFVQISNTEYTIQKIVFGLAGPFGDIDNDGDQDLVLVSWTGNVFYIYKNDGLGNFSKAASISKSPVATAVLLDMDSDGFLDLVELNSNEGKIYLNDGHGQFSTSEDISVAPPTPTAQILTVTFGDADNDNDLDLYYSYIWDDFNNFAENRFYLNNGSGNFIKEPDTSVIVSNAATTMSVNWVDYNNDGYMDIYVLESGVYGSPNEYTGILYENKGGLVFEKRFIEDNPYYNAHKTSSMWGDIDNDGDQDLYISVDKNNFYDHVSSIRHNLLFQNNGDGSFTEITENVLVDSSSHTSNLEDFDNDGDLDALLVAYGFANNGTNYLIENKGNDNSWIELTCEGTYSNKTALGAHINAIATINGKREIQTREINPTTGHNTIYSSSRIHFGLGDAENVDTLIIRWPLGHVDTFINIQANHIYRAIEDIGIELDLKAGSYIDYEPYIQDTVLHENDNLSFDLSEHYQFIAGDTIPEIEGDSLTYLLYDNDNPDVVNASLQGSILLLSPGTNFGIATIKVKVSADFIQRSDAIRVEYKEPAGIGDIKTDLVKIYPNPVCDILFIEYLGNMQEVLRVEIVDASGRVVWSGTSEKPVLSINLSSVTNGIYFLKVFSKEHCEIKRITKN
jgi:enediyne biosynthesis protein E4